MLMPHGWEGRTQPDRQLQQRGPERETPKEPTAWIHQGDNKRLSHVGAGRGDGVLRDMVGLRGHGGWVGCEHHTSGVPPADSCPHASPPFQAPGTIVRICVTVPTPLSQAAPEGDQAGGEQREEQHAQEHPPEPVVHTELAPPHLGQKGLQTEGSASGWQPPRPHPEPSSVPRPKVSDSTRLSTVLSGPQPCNAVGGSGRPRRLPGEDGCAAPRPGWRGGEVGEKPAPGSRVLLPGSPQLAPVCVLGGWVTGLSPGVPRPQHNSARQCCTDM